MKILYLHGFASAGSTGTALSLRNNLYEHGIEVISPDIPVHPSEAVPFLDSLVEELQPNLIIGTSMGAMYAEMQHGYHRILVNSSFLMSRSLTFNHMGKNVQFRNRRQDGATQFKVDRALIDEFKDLEKTRVLHNISVQDKPLVWGLFGLNDRMVNFQKEFQKAYGKEHFITFDGEHHLNDAILHKVVKPLIKEILKID